MKGILTLVVLFTAISAQARTASTWIYNETKKDLIYADRSNITRPIASLTKVMTALVALEHDSDMSKPVLNTSGTKLPPGTNTRGDLFSAMLIRSDNQAAELLAKSYPGGRKAFIKAMNNRAQSLGMTSTLFVDPSGLSSGNISSVGEIAMMMQIASLQPIIADTSILRQVEIKNKKFRVLLDNTNRMLLADFSEIKFSKTGFTNASGWSVGMILERHGQRFVVVVLGARTKEERYNLAKDLIKRHFADIEYDLEQEKQNRGYWENLLGIYRDIWIIDRFLNINEK